MIPPKIKTQTKTRTNNIVLQATKEFGEKKGKMETNEVHQ